MSQMNIDATVDQLGDDFDVQGAAASRKKALSGWRQRLPLLRVAMVPITTLSVHAMSPLITPILRLK